MDVTITASVRMPDNREHLVAYNALTENNPELTIRFTVAGYANGIVSKEGHIWQVGEGVLAKVPV